MAIYRKLAPSMGVLAEQVLLAETGAIMEFSQDFGKITGKAPGRPDVCRWHASAAMSAMPCVRDRQMLAQDGILMVVVSVDARPAGWWPGRIWSAAGFVYVRNQTDLLERAKQRVRNSLERRRQRRGRGELDMTYIQRKIKDVGQRVSVPADTRRPMVLPVVMEV